MVRLEYSVELDYFVNQTSEFVFLVHAARTGRQHLVSESLMLPPSCVSEMLKPVAPEFNRYLRVHVDPSKFLMRYSAVVDIDHFTAEPDSLQEIPIADLPIEALHYLRPSRYCPSDQFVSIAVQEFGAIDPGYKRVKAIADWVKARTTFQIGTSNTSHTAIDTLQNRTGVCRDFAHLMISLCRALNLPARYTTSLDYGALTTLGPPDFHAYVEVYLSGRWFIFDPTGITVPMGLVRIARGSDASDVPFATIFGNVLWSMPKIQITAVGNADGNVRPEHTDMAISTSEVVHKQSRPTEHPQFVSANTDSPMQVH